MDQPRKVGWEIRYGIIGKDFLNHKCSPGKQPDPLVVRVLSRIKGPVALRPLDYGKLTEGHLQQFPPVHFKVFLFFSKWC